MQLRQAAEQGVGRLQRGKTMKVQALRTWSRVLLMILVVIHLVTWYVLGVHAVGSIGIGKV